MRVILQFVLFLFISSIPLKAQHTFQEYQDIPVQLNNENLTTPWAGGLNGVQYSQMDLNSDGRMDLVIYDRSSTRILTFLQQNNRYQYAPAYEAFFPDEVFNFLILADFNCDGHQDLFTAGNAGIIAFKNLGTNPPSWELVNNFLTYEGLSGTPINLQVNFGDYPSIRDIDGDGDLDILNFNYSGIDSFIQLYKNLSVENGNACGIEELKLVNDYWGTIEECNCGSFTFEGESCDDLNSISRAMNSRHAGGKSILAADFDQDGVIDLVTSHEECRENYYFSNQVSTVDNPVYDGFTTNFPSAENPSHMNFYPNTFWMDLDFDGLKDLVVSPNLASNFGSNTNFKESNWFYKNNGTADNPNFQLNKKNFLQDEMIDFGEQSSPAAWDYDNDGDQDLFVAYSKLNAEGEFISSIALLENVGSPTDPSFEIQTEDYAQLSNLGLANMRIQFIDLNDDGRLDMSILGTDQNVNRLLYILQDENASFSANTIQEITDVPLGFGFFAYRYDVNQDGAIDLLIGKSSGGLIYYRNTGTNESPAFTVENNTFLDISDNFFRSSLRVTIGDLDGDGNDDLIASDLSGVLKIYSDVRNNLGTYDSISTYNTLSERFDAYPLGEENNVVLAPLFDQEYNTLIIGTISGGLRILRNTEEFPIGEADKTTISLYPNPNNTNRITVNANKSGTVTIVDVKGKILFKKLPIYSEEPLQIPTSDFSSGLYIATFNFAGEEKVVRKFIVE